jgi:hypothetical protein
LPLAEQQNVSLSRFSFDKPPKRRSAKMEKHQKITLLELEMAFHFQFIARQGSQ